MNRIECELDLISECKLIKIEYEWMLVNPMLMNQIWFKLKTNSLNINENMNEYWFGYGW